MTFAILGSGTASPAHTMSTDEAVEMAKNCVCRDERQARMIRAVVRQTQIDERHFCVPHKIAYEWVPVPPAELSAEQAELSRGPTTGERMRLYAEHAAPLALSAAGSAIESAGIEPRDFTHLITVCCTGFEAPGFDIELIDRLGLPPTTERIQIGFMGCHGAINGMRAALGVTASDPAARVLLCATELCSLHFCFSWDPDRILGNVLFADGSAALVCGERDDSPDCWQVAATGSCLVRGSREAITWRIGDFGFEMSLSNRVPELIQEHLRPWLVSWLVRQGLSIAEIGSWAVHPGGPKIVDAVAEALELPADATRVSRDILRRHGNMSSPTILFILDQFRRENAARPVVALGFGPGLVVEAALIV